MCNFATKLQRTMKVKYLKLKSWLLVTLMGAMGLTGCHTQKKIAKTPAEIDTEDPEMIEQRRQREEIERKQREREEMRVMYGVPTMNYMIRGEVRGDNGQPVPNIHINMLERGMEVEADTLVGAPEAIERWLANTATITDEQGRFSLTQSGMPQENVRLMVHDEDGAANGEYRTQVIEVPVQAADMDRTNASGWNQGTFNKEVKVRLQSKR